MSTVEMVRAAHPHRRAVWLTVIGLAFVLGGSVAWLGWSAMEARDALFAARAEVGQLQEQARLGRIDEARTTLEDVQRHASLARERTSGPLWAVAGALPWAGPNVQAVRAVAGAVDELATHALPPLVEATALVDPAALQPVGGRIDVQPLADVAPQIAGADTAITASLQRIEDVDTTGLIDAVADPVTQLRGQLADVAADTATASRAAALLPAMLGVDGPRTYLVLVQNNAEPRATGGIAGAVLLLRATDGHLEVLEQRRGGELAGLPEPVVALSDAEKDLFGPLLGTDMRDVNFTPDFPRSGRIAKGVWESQVGGVIDGVLSVDPGALALVLDATGPVPLPDGSQLTGDNVVPMLLNQVYLELEDPAEQDAFFALTAAAVFGAVAGGQGDATGVVDALAEAARRGRLMVWSADEDEQARLSGTVLSGELQGRRGNEAVVGLYLNDGTQAKLGYYLQADASVEVTECLPDGSQRVRVEATFIYEPPADVLDLPPYLLGLDGIVPLGEFRTNVLLYVPANGKLDAVRVNTEAASLHAQVHDGLSVGALTWDFTPGATYRLEADITTGPGQDGAVLLRTSPLAAGFDHVAAVSKCEGAR
ncbi:DUF4012 domain-containing protein [Cellulomonas sp. Sa3CUA2]|uniref:DUF4012 domain-containing protein n=1 Tax=Cellulomonas avistercoris TaxID=2762242 RepID=A0ABR8Q9Y2_9CELL|nr:DUF4012 domain-containing protein [Cellulomonas avistercoris]MBD7917219.1 DUF4012 domain-containing protein [Cellulomonas avistercoris]